MKNKCHECVPIMGVHSWLFALKKRRLLRKRSDRFMTGHLVFRKKREEIVNEYNCKKLSVLFAAVMMFVLACPVTVLAAAEEEAGTPAVYATFWSLIPPVVAIVLALITKEVYSSLFLGILVGALLYSGGNFEGTVNHIFSGWNDQCVIIRQ